MAAQHLMKGRDIRNDIIAATNVIFIIIIGVLLVSASSVVILMYQGGQSAEAPDIETVSWGDTIKANYTGRLSDGRVFDTSHWEVASNDALYPKSLEFQLKNQSKYKPLEFTVGAGNIIPGFESGVVGMELGKTQVLEIPPEKAYGPLNQSKLVTVPMIQQEPVFETYNFSEFTSTFDVAPHEGLALEHPKWGWDLSVISVDAQADSVMVKNSPELDAKYPVYGADLDLEKTGWYVTVDSYDSSANGGKGEIVVRHLLEPSDAQHLKGIDASGSQFILHQVDTDTNELVFSYNGELVGKTLHFTVTIVEISEPQQSTT